MHVSFYHFVVRYLTLVVLCLAGTCSQAVQVMSVNQCTDQMIGILSPDQLVSVTWLSHESQAPMANLLTQIPENYAEIEEVLHFSPDIVIGGEYGAPGLKALLARFEIPWRELPLPQSFPELYQNWRTLGHWLNRQDRAEMIIARLTRQLADIEVQIRPLAVRALIVNPNGWIAGEGNFQSAFLQAIGLTNLALEKGIKGWGQLSLEQLVLWRPDLIVIPESGYDGSSRATEWQRHPVFTSMSGRYPVLQIDASWLSCGTESVLLAGNVILRHIKQFRAGADHGI